MTEGQFYKRKAPDDLMAQAVVNFGKIDRRASLMAGHGVVTTQQGVVDSLIVGAERQWRQQNNTPTSHHNSLMLSLAGHGWVGAGKDKKTHPG